MLLIGKTISDIKDIKMSSSFELEMKDLGHAKRNFGMDIKRNRIKQILFLSQASYIEKVLSKFSIHESEFVFLPIAVTLNSVRTSV